MLMSLSKDTSQIQFTERCIGWQILHICHAVMGEIDFLGEKSSTLSPVMTVFCTSHWRYYSPKSFRVWVRIFNLLKFTVIQGQLMPCKHIQSDYRWAMEIQAYLGGIVHMRERILSQQSNASHPVSSRSSITFRFLGGWNPKKVEISLWEASRTMRYGMWLTQDKSNNKGNLEKITKQLKHEK